MRSNTFIPDVEMSHYFFIVKGLEKLFDVNLEDEASIQRIKDFIATNKTKINSIKVSFETTPKVLGTGADGIAFSVGRGLVFKMFQDYTAYSASIEAIKRLHEFPSIAKTEALIYDAGILGEYKAARYNSPVYYYLIEKMTPIAKQDVINKKALKKVMDEIKIRILRDANTLWRPMKQQLEDPANMSQIKQIIELQVKPRVAQFAKSISTSINDWFGKYVKKVDPKNTLRSEWLIFLTEEILMKFLTSRGDLEMRNLGITGQGYLRFFDPAIKGYENKLGDDRSFYSSFSPSSSPSSPASFNAITRRTT
jgi:hypothetical protein